MSRIRKVSFRLTAVLISTLFALLLAETALQLLERADTSSQRLDYGDVWRKGPRGPQLGPGGFLQEGFRGQVIDGLGGTVLWVNNSQGFRAEVDFQRHPPAGTRRILSIGDSFTGGYRVGQNESFSQLIADWSSQAIGPTEVLISVTEDPPTAVDYLGRFGHGWHPHLVLFGLTLGNDISQSYFHYDLWSETLLYRLEQMEVPQECLGTGRHRLLMARRSLLFQRLFPLRGINSSYGQPLRPKLFDAVQGLGAFLVKPVQQVETAYRRTFRALREMQEICSRHRLPLVVALFPQRFQVDPEDWRWTIFEYGLKEECFDLTLPNRRLAEFCREEGLTCLDPTQEMTRRALALGESLYLPQGDMHWNARGHRALFESLQPQLLPLLRDLPLKADY